MSKRNGGIKNGKELLGFAEISGITVAGYKSIGREQTAEIRPLTILAGANSSGKSSIMQPLLLLKQTLESSYDPGALLLDGPNVRFTSALQALSTSDRKSDISNFSIEIKDKNKSYKMYFSVSRGSGFNIQEMVYSNEKGAILLRPSMTTKEIFAAFPEGRTYVKTYSELDPKAKISLSIRRNRCFLEPTFDFSGYVKQVGLANKTMSDIMASVAIHAVLASGSFELPSTALAPHITHMIHLPGLRGNPERNYPATAVGSSFPGTFEAYTASVIAQWQVDKKEDKLKKLGENLEKLGLTWKVASKAISDTQVELLVGRLPHSYRGGAYDLVNIADVGFGVSQTLPVLVALQAAQSGQLVYLEQPEIHLHPRAQTVMAQVLTEAAMRGVRVIVETHSSLLLLGIQTLVAEGKLPPELVKLHWFTRGDDGMTTIRSADLDEAGAFGDWPEDFADVELAAESRYLDAAEARQRVH